jgi:hypothetical protein
VRVAFGLYGERSKQTGALMQNSTEHKKVWGK